MPIAPPQKKVWVIDRDTLFQFLEMLNDKYGSDLLWRWTGQDKEPMVEVYSPSLGLSVSGRMAFIQETVETMLSIWGFEET